MTNISKMAFEIDSCSLAKLVCHADFINKVLIVDCRCFLDYNISHIRNAVNAFYSKMMRRRLYDNKVCDSAMLSQLGQENCGELVMDLVLYSDTDDRLPSPSTCALQKLSKRKCGTTVVDDSPSKFLRTLHEKLTSSKKFHRVLILRDGFGDFQNRFPELCEGSPSPSPAQMIGGGGSASCPQIADGPTEILPFMYLGSQQDALSPELLKKYGIDYVINLSVNCPQPASVQKDGHFMRIPINDSYEDKLLPHFEEAFKFLDNVSQRGSVVLIHCLAGISRSPTLAIAYIMRQYKWTSDRAYRFVKAKRPSISPNFNFMGQLLEYEVQLRAQSCLIPSPPNVSESISTPPVAPPLVAHSLDSSASKSPNVFQSTSQQTLAGEHVTKIAKSASCNTITPNGKLPRPQSFWDSDTSEPSSKMNENGKRIMETAASKTTANYFAPLDRPRALCGLKARKGLEIPLVAMEELPSPSNEFRKLSFTPSPSTEISASNPFFAMLHPAIPASPQPSTSAAVPSTAAQNPLETTFETGRKTTVEQQSSCCSKTASSPSCSASSPSPAPTTCGHKFFVSFFKKGIFSSSSSSTSSSSSSASAGSHHRNTGILRSTTLPAIASVASNASVGSGQASTSSSTTRSKLPSVPEVTRSQSDYMIDETESPESGFVEGEYLRSATGSDAIDFESETTGGAFREPDRDSVSSASSLEIIVK